MAARIAWVLNLDAELELATAGPYTPSLRSRGLVRQMASLVRDLVGPADVVLQADSGPTQARAGRCWCPTPSALAQLTAHGVPLPTAPTLEVLRRVNHRAFTFGLTEPFDGSALVATEAELLAALARTPWTGRWVAKRAFGFSGRGLRVLRPAPDGDDLAFCRASLQPPQGLLLEPWVQRSADFVLHGTLEASGQVRLGRPLHQQVDERGRWQHSAPMQAGALAPDEARRLHDAAAQVADALHAAHYQGPFGLDAFRYQDPHGAPRFRPLVEVNARYCMGWGVGMADALREPTQPP